MHFKPGWCKALDRSASAADERALRYSPEATSLKTREFERRSARTAVPT